MPEITVEVQRDYLERLAAANPIEGIVELIWNALDADAKRVDIRLIQNHLGGVETVEVTDNGEGIPYPDAESAFGNLGGSLKTARLYTTSGRRLHGKRGQGRFRAFSIGDHIEWSTKFKENGSVKEHVIVGDRSTLGRFTANDGPQNSRDSVTGTQVDISRLPASSQALTSEESLHRLTEQVALYLREYPSVQIHYDGERIDPARIEKAYKDYELEPIAIDDGRTIDATLTVIEWNKPIERSLHLCDAEGFSLTQIAPEIRAPGFDFTSYLKSEFFRELAEHNALVEMNPDLMKVTDAARDKLRKHFKSRESEMGAIILQGWKEQNIYPYSEPPTTEIEKSERQVFDVVALNVNEYMPSFDRTDQQNKRLTLQLVKTAIEQGPRALRRILQDVLNLPKDKQEEFARLLDQTSLTAIINASRKIADRLDFIRGLEILVFNPVTRSTLLERRHLHKILENETWVFGESFNLSTSDQSLTNVLNKHLALLGREPGNLAPVLIAGDRRSKIVDLMLSRAIPQPRAEEREHLVVELKRPKQPIDEKVQTQIEGYAYAVANDERFRDTKTKWVFWAISNDITDRARWRARREGKPEGLLHDEPGGKVLIWVKSWGEVIEECRGRLEFFRQQLEYQADDPSALDYLHRLHEQYLPKHLATDS